MKHHRLQLAIVDFTDRNYTTPERFANVIKPILYPIYENLMVALKKSPLFTWPGSKPGDMIRPPHTLVERPFYGTQGTQGNEKFEFSDPLDAIEIINLEINQRITNC